jgi:hypothetical protein
MVIKKIRSLRCQYRMLLRPACRQRASADA